MGLPEFVSLRTTDISATLFQTTYRDPLTVIPTVTPTLLAHKDGMVYYEVGYRLALCDTVTVWTARVLYAVILRFDEPHPSTEQLLGDDMRDLVFDIVGANVHSLLHVQSLFGVLAQCSGMPPLPFAFPRTAPLRVAEMKD